VELDLAGPFGFTRSARSCGTVGGWGACVDGTRRGVGSRESYRGRDVSNCL